MTFRSHGQISLLFPPFRGVTRRIILIAVGVSLGLAVLALFSHELAGTLNFLLLLRTDKSLHPLVWELITYPFAGSGLFSIAFATLSIWLFGSSLEEERGPLWMTEYFLTATIGGAIVGLLLYLAGQRYIPGLEGNTTTGGLWPAVFAFLAAYGKLHAEDQVNFGSFFTLKAKYVAAIYVLIFLGLTLTNRDRFGALVALCNALAGYVFLQVAPRYGFRVRVSERWYALRSLYYRSKRKRAAKKNELYMRKQGGSIPVDQNRHDVHPDGKPRDPL